MTGGFNPYRAGLPPSEPNVSADLVAQLLGGGTGNIINSIAGGLQKSGEISRTSKLNELLASGTFDDMNSKNVRSEIAKATGGSSIDPTMAKALDSLLSGKVEQESEQAKALASLGLEDRKFKNELSKLGVENQYDLNRLAKEQSFEYNKMDKQSQNRLRELSYQSGVDFEKLNMQQKNAMAMELYKQGLKPKDEKISITEKPFVEKGGKTIAETENIIPVLEDLFTSFSAGDKSVFTLPLLGSTDVLGGLLNVDKEDMSTSDRRLIQDVITESLLGKKGQVAASLANPELAYSDLKDRLASRGYVLDTEFSPLNLLPFGDNPRTQKIRKMTKKEIAEYEELKSKLK